MLRRILIVSTLVAALVAYAPPAWAQGTDDATVSINATVDSFAEWSNAAPTIAASEFAGSTDGTTVTVVGESLTVTKILTLWTNVNLTIQPSAGVNAGILTNGTQTLTTTYQVQGDVGVPDAAYKAALGASAGQFFWAGITPNTYAVTHVSGDGSYAINLLAKGESSTTKASDAGTYTCGVILTATWT